jgi:predicted transposase YdaD
MTIAEYFKNKGKAEGKAEGEAKGQAKGKVMAKEAIANKMRSMGFEPADIREITELSDDELAKTA